MPTRSESPAAVERLAASLLVAVGLGLAGWLTLLKWRSLPCLGGGCDQVIQSRYGSLLGLPVGVYGAVLWAALAWPLGAPGRRVVHAALALGALGFMVIQFGVLRAFCPYCTAHAVAAVTAWRWRRVRPAWWALGLGAALAAGGYVLAQRAADRRAESTAQPMALAAGTDALFLFDAGPVSAGGRPVLVLSLTCPACLDLLGEVVARPWPTGRAGPAVYVKAEPRERTLAAVWIAACVETAGSTPPERVAAVTAILLEQRELVLADPAAAAAWLAGIFNPSAEARRAAEDLLARQAVRLAGAGVTTTPWFWTVTGGARARVTAGDLWR